MLGGGVMGRPIGEEGSKNYCGTPWILQIKSLYFYFERQMSNLLTIDDFFLKNLKKWTRIEWKHRRTTLAKMWWLAWRVRGVYMWFSIPYFISDPSQYLQYVPSAQTFWLTDYQTKLINEWLNEWISLQCPFDLSQRMWKWKEKRYFFKVSQPRIPFIITEKCVNDCL